MKKWEYAHVPYLRNHNPGEPCVQQKHTAMSDIESKFDLHSFLNAAGERGWELTGTVLPFPPGKELCEDVEHGETEYILEDPLDIQWLIFKREK